mmetsp:Transcript_26953/g.43379  ORF Transcript_26953/g.43379 Transcript_26953/m.43379 type:complete len:208 (+) Transcript_26953:210-833(+)
MTLGVYMIVKYRRAPTIESFISTFFLYAKAAVVLAAYLLDTRIFVWYLIIYGVMLLTLQLPTFNWGEDVEVFNPPNLASYILKGQEKVTWVVFFYAPWNQGCADFVPTFSDIADKYKSNSLRFGKVDVARFPELAEQFNIETDVNSVQLPTIILFEKCEEHSRLPPMNSENKPIQTLIDHAGTIAYFQLDARSSGSYEPTSRSKKGN